MSERAPYSRVYWKIRDDSKFDTIRGDDHHLSTWLRLLIAADMAYPAPADLPATARKASVKALVAAELIDLMPDGLFRLRGLKAERESRAWSRVGPRQDLDRTDVGPQLSQAEQSKAKPSTAPRDPVVYFYEKLGRFPSDNVRTWIDDLTEEFGTDAVIGALDTEYAKDPDKRTLMGRIRDRLKANARELGVKERKAEVDANLQRRLERTQRYLREMRGETA